jgi:hypothetical protein
MNKKYVSKKCKNGIVLRNIEESDNPIATSKECKRINDYKDVIGIQTKKSFEDFFIELGKKVTRCSGITDLPTDDDFLSLVAKVVLDNEIPNEYYIETRRNFKDHKVYIIKTEDR